MTESSLKTLLDLLIRVLTLFIPWLGGLLNLPVIGWVAKMGISYLTSLLASLIERRIAFGGIDTEVEKQVQDAKDKTEDLKRARLPGVSDEEKQKAFEAFKNAMRNLARN